MPEILSPSAFARLKKRSKTIARVTGISPIAAHDQVSREAGYKNWAQLRKIRALANAAALCDLTPLPELSILLTYCSLSTTLRYRELLGVGERRLRRPAAKQSRHIGLPGGASYFLISRSEAFLPFRLNRIMMN